MKINYNKEPVIKETVFIESSKLKTDFSNKTNIIFLIIGILLISCVVLGLFNILGEYSNISSPSFFSSIYSIFLLFLLSLYFIWSSIYESGINEKLNFYVENNNKYNMYIQYMFFIQFILLTLQFRKVISFLQVFL